MKKFGIIAGLLLLLFVAVIAVKSYSDGDTTTPRYASDGSRIVAEADLANLPDDEDVTVYLDGNEPASPEAIAALPPCAEVAKVEPPKQSFERCRTPQGGETLISVYWEDHFMKKPEAPIAR